MPSTSDLHLTSPYSNNAHSLRHYPTLRRALGTKFDNVNLGTEYLEAT
jgi:hypothetical protein